MRFWHFLLARSRLDVARPTPTQTIAALDLFTADGHYIFFMAAAVSSSQRSGPSIPTMLADYQSHIRTTTKSTGHGLWYREYPDVDAVEYCLALRLYDE
ncbi:MAG: hypothetical protein ABF780_03850 [Bifidobacterium aquikefiri]|uniref:hypothetical protein n=1 Tax=Bifidobacterium aquikefiri TaxID=1653207 RepID=UPI0013039FFF|nr:hypothetical protein [Bifidobacterium aquikefiri]